MKLSRSSKQENLVYVVLWTILFALPIVVFQLRHTSDAEGFPWHEVLHLWVQFVLFLVAFTVHNYLLAPLIVYRRKHLLYFSSIAVLLACFVFVQCMHQPDSMHEGPKHKKEAAHRPPMMDDEALEPMSPPDHEGDFKEAPPAHKGDFREAPRHRHDKHRPGDKPPMIFSQHDIISTIVLILMLGMNIGVKLYFRRREDEHHMADLERQNLEQQLTFLRYQINPHFLMNTLNNIHALVDIEPEQAKETIVGLSKILRFVLYEGSKQMVPLDRELGFLENYIELMSMRLADQVDMIVDLPSHAPDVQVPPLLFITFVENAFKHGVSYQQHSFIDIHAAIEDSKISFNCRNSKAPQSANKKPGGVGLQNARRRLDLIYGNRYRLDIDEDEQTYSVTLEIPTN